MVMAHLFAVRLFPKMKVRRNGMLKQVNNKISDQHVKQRAFPA
jgi:hypothetical protein